ncbi:MAG: winged helix-turn-helix domain-containing protein, partial [Prevotella sp.]|nr:winged helix-turn-helix domain-containing protein [Prevotella sp.]
INLLNIVSAQSHRLQRYLWHPQPQSLDQRIVRFIAERSLRPAGPKLLHIKMTRLADELNESRLNVSRALNRLQKAGLLTLGREKIEILALERLIS